MGCGQLGTRVVGREAVDLVHAAFDAGITLFDTADVYGQGESERVLGKALEGKHDSCVIATKFRHAGPQPGASRKSIRVGLEASLRRLNVDYIDLYQLHAPDPATPIEATIDALQDLVAQGKILSFGLCNVAAWQVVDAQRVAWGKGGSAVSTAQVPINAVQTAHLLSLRPVAGRFGIGLLAATPLGRGLLGGRYSRDSPPPARHPLISNKGVELWSDTGMRQAERVLSIAQDLGLSPAQVALGALLAQPEIAAVLVGLTATQDIDQLSALEPEAVSAAHARELLRPPSAEKL
jgi:aryl-alcohol dehydrogenase-like predicted oxidoreductase